MRTEYAILRDGSKIPVSELYLDTESPVRHYPLRCSSDSAKNWTMSGHYEIAQSRHSYDILNIDDVLETISPAIVEYPLAQYRTPQAMADTHAAYARGEKIEFINTRSTGEFDTCYNPKFDWIKYTYRPALKWEPKVGEVVLAKLTNSRIYQLCFYAGYCEPYYDVALDPEHTGAYYAATDIKPFTQDK